MHAHVRAFDREAGKRSGWECNREAQWASGTQQDRRVAVALATRACGWIALAFPPIGPSARMNDLLTPLSVSLCPAVCACRWSLDP